MKIVDVSGPFCYLLGMENSSNISKLAGRVGSLLCFLGVVSFFFGIFGGPRTFAFAGVALIAAALIGFFIEEQTARK